MIELIHLITKQVFLFFLANKMQLAEFHQNVSIDIT